MYIGLELWSFWHQKSRPTDITCLRASRCPDEQQSHPHTVMHACPSLQGGRTQQISWAPPSQPRRQKSEWELPPFSTSNTLAISCKLKNPRISAGKEKERNSVFYLVSKFSVLLVQQLQIKLDCYNVYKANSMQPSPLSFTASTAEGSKQKETEN